MTKLWRMYPATDNIAKGNIKRCKCMGFRISRLHKFKLQRNIHSWNCTIASF